MEFNAMGQKLSAYEQGYEHGVRERAELVEAIKWLTDALEIEAPIYGAHIEHYRKLVAKD